MRGDPARRALKESEDKAECPLSCSRRGEAMYGPLANAILLTVAIGGVAALVRALVRRHHDENAGGEFRGVAILLVLTALVYLGLKHC